jgi:hypothetical protein
MILLRKPEIHVVQSPIFMNLVLQEAAGRASGERVLKHHTH